MLVRIALYLFLLVGFCRAEQTPTPDPSQTTSQEASEHHVSKLLVGLDLQYLIPDNFSGLSLPQTLTGAHFGFSLGEDNLHLIGFYNSNPETSTFILSEVNYQFNLSTPFIRGYALLGLHYLHFRVAFKDKHYVGPVAGFGFDLPMARNFKMGLHMKLYVPQKVMLGFGGGFTFLL